MTQHEPDNEGADALDCAPWASPVQKRPEDKPQRARRRPKSSYADIFTAAVAGVAAVVGVYALVIYEGQLGAMEATLLATQDAANAAKIQAETARQEFEVSQRPWISVVAEINGAITRDANNVTIPVAYFLKNVGNTPAVRVAIEAEVVYPIGEFSPSKAQAEFCAKIRSRDLSGFGFTAFPGDPIRSETAYIVSRTEVDAGNARHPMADRYFSMMLVGCVDYRYPFADVRRQEGFIFHVQRKDPAHPNIRFALPVADVIPDAVLDRLPIGGGYSTE